jgi:hypothetical protein
VTLEQVVDPTEACARSAVNVVAGGKVQLFENAIVLKTLE